MEPQMMPYDMSPPEQFEPMPAHEIAPGGCYPAPNLPEHAPYSDWVLDLINDYLPGHAPIPVEPYGTPV